MNTSVYSSTTYNSQDGNGLNRSTDEWIKKMWYIYIMEYCSVITKNEMMPFAVTWMEQKMIILSEVSQKEKDK